MDFSEYDPTPNKEELWQVLEADQQAPDAKQRPLLAGLSVAEQERLAQAWPQLPPTARRQLLAALIELAEDDFALDFRAVFTLALADPDGRVRATAINGLWEEQDVRLISQLGRFLLEDEVEEVRLAAAQALANFILLGELQKIPPLFFEKAYQFLLTAHRNPAETLEVRRRALESLAYAGQPEVSALIQAAYQDPAEKMRISALFAMGRSADRRWNATVTQHLASANPAMRYEAVRACGELAIREALPELIELIQDVDVEIQQTALWAVGQIGGERAHRTLQRYQSSENELWQTAADDALQELEFLHGNLNKFYDSPERFNGEGELSWEEEWHPWRRPENDI